MPARASDDERPAKGDVVPGPIWRVAALVAAGREGRSPSGLPVVRHLPQEVGGPAPGRELADTQPNQLRRRVDRRFHHGDRDLVELGVGELDRLGRGDRDEKNKCRRSGEVRCEPHGTILQNLFRRPILYHTIQNKSSQYLLIWPGKPSARVQFLESIHFVCVEFLPLAKPTRVRYASTVIKVFFTSMKFVSLYSTTRWLLLVMAIVAASVGLMLTAVATPASALSCIAPGTPEEETEKADLVFYGTVTGVVIDEGDEGVGGDETGTITFSVEEWFKGEGEEVTLALGSYSTWYSEPVAGDKAVIYVTDYDDSGELSMPLCSRSVIGEGAAVEVALLRGEEPPVLPPVVQVVGCHGYFSGMPVRGGFGAAFDTNGDAVYLQAECSSADGVTLYSVTPGMTYATGYFLVENEWRSFSFAGEDENGDWFMGPAAASIPDAWVTPGESHYFLALTCQMVGGEWQCGCQDAGCAEPAWQLQEVNVPDFNIVSEPDVPEPNPDMDEVPVEDDEMIACTMDAMMCPDGSYVGRTGPNCEFVCPLE